MQYPVFTTSPELDEGLVNPKFWADEEWLHEQFRWLRANDPIRYIEPDAFDPFWSITRHADILAIEGDKRLFINDPRPLLSPKMLTAMVEAMAGRKHLVRSLVQMDDPDHAKYRAIAHSWFLGSNLRRLTDRIDAIAKEYVDRLVDLGGECDFYKDIAIWYPLRVIMSILGVPEADEPRMMKLTQELFGGTDPDIRRSFEDTAVMEVVADFDAYFEALSTDRRAKPTDDIASVIANAKIDGESLPLVETNSYYTIIATAGHDTTSATTAGGLLALLQHPDEFTKLRADPDAHMATAVEEIIRWVTPVRQFVRTATRDCEVGGTAIAEGESCALWYPSANRDETVFEAPFEFRVDRNDGRQIAFGYGAHVCLGQHLARMEIAAFYKELLRRVEHVELAGEPRFKEAGFVGGLKSLPIRYTMR